MLADQHPEAVLDMELTPGTSVFLRPVVEAEGRVRRGLDLGNGDAGAEGMHRPSREMVEVPPLHGDSLQEPGIDRAFPLRLGRPPW